MNIKCRLGFVHRIEFDRDIHNTLSFTIHKLSLAPVSRRYKSAKKKIIIKKTQNKVNLKTNIHKELLSSYIKWRKQMLKSQQT